MVTEQDIQINDNNYSSKASALAIISLFASERTGIDANQLLAGFQKREVESNTAIGEEFAIPHAILSGINQSYVFLHIFENGIDWEAYDDKKVRIAFSLIVAQENHNDQHIRKLSAIACSLMDEEVQKILKESRNKKELSNLVNEMGEKL